jgi:protein-tyrosine phosphatase
MCEDGVRTAIATPHLIDGVYENVRSRVEPLTAELNRRLAAESIPLTVLPGAEVDFSSRYLTEDTHELPSLGGGPGVLLEMPVAVIPPAISETIFALHARGLVPLIAHPERNELLQDNPMLVRPWLEVGARLQLDGDSLLGVWGKHTQHCAERLLLAGFFHAMASDAHSVDKRPPRMTAALERARALVGNGAMALVRQGPELLLGGRHLPTPLYEVDRQIRVEVIAQQPSRRRFFRRWLDRSGEQL